MRYPLTYLWPLLVSLAIQGLLNTAYWLRTDLMDRQSMAVVAACGIAVACVSLVGYRLLNLAQPKAGWSLPFVGVTLIQFLCLGSSVWFLLAALIGRPPSWS